MSYPLSRLREEVAFIAVELGWGYDEILAMPHKERIQWVKTLNRLKTGN